MTVTFPLILLLLLAQVSPAVCFASFKESLGSVDIEDVLLRPSFTVYEPQQGEFSLGESSFSLLWTKEPGLAARVRVGRQSLMNTPLHFEDKTADNFGFFEAYGQYTGAYGRVRLGLIPIEFGVEGSMVETVLVFPRSLLFSKKVVGLRDYGASYFVENKGFYTRLGVHNGEAGRNSDGRVFYTAAWGWQNKRNVEVGAAGQAGETKSESTATSGDTLAGVDPLKEALWRVGQFYLHWYPNNWQLLVQFNWGELEQEKKGTKFVGGNFDLSYSLPSSMGFHLRYDQLDPNHDEKNDLLREVTAGFSISGDHKNSTLFILATKLLEEKVETSNDRYMIIWRLTPLAQ